MNLLGVIALIVAVRLLSVFLVQTWYVPDEYWQSLEVAHRLVFGYGYLTWEWVAGIRSYIYPLWFAGIYKALAWLNFDSVELLVLLPRITQALLTAYADYSFFNWCGRKKWALFITLTPWYTFYTGSRTLINTLEASLNTIALSRYPWGQQQRWWQKESFGYLWLVGLICFLRPTAAIIWLPLCIQHIRKSNAGLPQTILKHFLPIGAVIAAICVAVDSYFYNRLIFTPFEFLKHNVFYNIGSFYGTHPWYWYLTIGLPVVLGINTLPFIWSIVQTLRNREAYPVRQQLLLTVALALLPLSLLNHKEFRFLASLLPICLYLCVDTLTRWSYKASRIWIWVMAVVILAGNALPAWYLSSVHQRGPMDLLPKLREIARDYRDDGARRASVLFLMPCHSTPFYSHVHENITMRFLTCEPNLKEQKDYKDEADQFFDAPAKWLRSHIPSYPKHAQPSHLVLFDSLTTHISDFLLNYKELQRIDHAEYVNSRTGKQIVLYQRLSADESSNVFNRQEKNEDEKKKRLYPDLAEQEFDELNEPHNVFN